MDHEVPTTTTTSSLETIPVVEDTTTTPLSEAIPAKKQKVHFGTVIINEHPIIVGCNPAVSSGVPLSIDWDRISQKIMSIQEYEIIRGPVRVPDFSMLMRDSSDRYFLLTSLGYSYKELRQAEKEMDILRKLRQESFEDFEYDRYHDDRNDIESQARGSTNTCSSSSRILSRSVHQLGTNLKLIPRRLRVRTVFRMRPVAGWMNYHPKKNTNDTPTNYCIDVYIKTATDVPSR